ncbi:MAG: hypothetical protein KatS3mg096_519 [Candidatus Parcubacteria bacterium]|nr:MAG: hypothetical protein KatS3mg096_519 [Candidatus Parcubacteria bacterium]
MNLIRKFLYQIVPVDVSLGLYDYLNKKIIVPDKESYLEGPINMSKWQELEKEDDGDTLNILKEGEFSLEHYLLNYIKPIENFEIPDIDDLISEKEINICN